MRKLPLLLGVFVLTFAVPTLNAANFKLYLKDGGFQLVREYKVEGDSVRYYSVERSDWEDIPAALVDLKRTDAEASEHKATLDKYAKALDEEAEAARENRREIMKIPRDPGAYRLEDDKLRVFDAADCAIRNSKGRNVLKTLVPVLSGKATLETPGEHSKNIVQDRTPEFFLQLSEIENFGMIKLTPAKGVRIVERIEVLPVVKEMEESRDLVPTFTKQLSDNGLYKIWPQDPLPPGEYAVVEFTDGKDNIQVWDFRIE